VAVDKQKVVSLAWEGGEGEESEESEKKKGLGDEGAEKCAEEHVQGVASAFYITYD
jgi:hypothetical protein